MQIWQESSERKLGPGEGGKTDKAVTENNIKSTKLSEGRLSESWKMKSKMLQCLRIPYRFMILLQHFKALSIMWAGKSSLGPYCSLYVALGQYDLGPGFTAFYIQWLHSGSLQIWLRTFCSNSHWVYQEFTTGIIPLSTGSSGVGLSLAANRARLRHRISRPVPHRTSLLESCAYIRIKSFFQK